jgi:hypothetical protein
MSGLPDLGRSEFDKYAKKYRDMGWVVFSPPEMDTEYDPGDYRGAIQRDAVVLLSKQVDRIYMLPNWRESKGARYERFAAETVGIPVYCAENGEAFVSHLVVLERNAQSTVVVHE